MKQCLGGFWRERLTNTAFVTLPAVLDGTIREAVQSAVQYEMRIKEARPSNIVISGVYSTSDGDGDVNDAAIPGRAPLLFVTFADQAAATYLIDKKA